MFSHNQWMRTQTPEGIGPLWQTGAVVTSNSVPSGVSPSPVNSSSSYNTAAAASAGVGSADNDMNLLTSMQVHFL